MPIPELVAAGIISGASSIASSIAGNEGSRRSQKRADNYNKAQWNRENAYNDPSQQMKRLQGAGLNPNLIYGTGGSTAVGNAGPAPQSKASPVKFDNPLADISQFARFDNTSANTDNLQTQNKVLEQEVVLKGSQIADNAAKTARSKFDLNLAQELKDTSVQAAQANVRNIEQNTIGREIDNRYQHQGLQDRLKKIYYEAQSSQTHLKGSQLDNRMKQLDIDLKQLGIEKGDPFYWRILGRATSGKSLKDTKRKANEMLNNWK